MTEYGAGRRVVVHGELVLGLDEDGRMVVDVDDLDVDVDAVLVGPVAAVLVGAVLGDHLQRYVALVANWFVESNGARVRIDGEQLVAIARLVERVGDLVVRKGLVQVVGLDDGNGASLVLVALDHARHDRVADELGRREVFLAQVDRQRLDLARSGQHVRVAELGDEKDDHLARHAVVERILDVELTRLALRQVLVLGHRKLELEPLGYRLWTEKAAQELIARIVVDDDGKGGQQAAALRRLRHVAQLRRIGKVGKVGRQQVERRLDHVHCHALAAIARGRHVLGVDFKGDRVLELVHVVALARIDDERAV